MSRNTLYTTAVLAAVLATAAVAMMCFGCDDSSAESDAPVLGAADAPSVPRDMEKQSVPGAGESPAERSDKGPGPMPPEYVKGTPPPLPEGRPPEGPAPVDEPPPRPAHGDRPPVVVIDASGRPHSPEDVLEEYSVIYKEKVALEMEGNEVVVYDEDLIEEAGEELAGVLFAIFGESLTSAAPEEGTTVTLGSSSGGASAEFLLLVLGHTEKGSWLNKLVVEMLDEQLRSSLAFRCMVPPDSRQLTVPDPPPEEVAEEQKDPSEPYVNDVPQPSPSSESYLVEHGFDGGALF